MGWAWESGESDLDRFTQMEIAQLQANAAMNVQEYKSRKDAITGIGKFIGDIVMPFVGQYATTGSFIGT